MLGRGTILDFPEELASNSFGPGQSIIVRHKTWTHLLWHTWLGFFEYHRHTWNKKFYFKSAALTFLITWWLMNCFYHFYYGSAAKNFMEQITSMWFLAFLGEITLSIVMWTLVWYPSIGWASWLDQNNWLFLVCLPLQCKLHLYLYDFQVFLQTK